VYRRVGHEDEGVEVTPLTSNPALLSLTAAGAGAGGAAVAAAAAAMRHMDHKKHTPPVSQSDTPQSLGPREGRASAEGDVNHASDQ
jgi:hypothetical protein